MVANVKANAANAPAAPYEPTRREAAALAVHRERAKAISPRPKMKTAFRERSDGSGMTDAKLVVDHKDGETGGALLEASLGSTDWNFVQLMLAQLAALSASPSKEGADLARDEKMLNSQLAIVQAVAPQNEIECMLAVQMAAVHGATMHMASNVRSATTPLAAESFERSVNRLGRTFAVQVETLRKLRSKGEQKVVVEHRHYHLGPGARAVFADVQAKVGVGRMQETEGQSHERSEPVRLSERAPVLGLVKADRVPMQSAGDEGQERVPVPRRQGRRSLRAS